MCKIFRFFFFPCDSTQTKQEASARPSPSLNPIILSQLFQPAAVLRWRQLKTVWARQSLHGCAPPASHTLMPRRVSPFRLSHSHNNLSLFFFFNLPHLFSVNLYGSLTFLLIS